MNKDPFISIIIPAYNPGDNLYKLLKSLKKSKFKDFEVIVCDDGSSEKINVDRSVCMIRINKNMGPARARNLASKKANGKILVFFDSDVEVYPDTLGTIEKNFIGNKKLIALTGVWDKHQKTNKFFNQFKALRDWSYWINERTDNGYYYLFSTRVAAIRKNIFDKLGGFNESFRQMEDVEFTYRLAKQNRIIFCPEVRVHHEFDNFPVIAKKYFLRSFYWIKLYVKRWKFDPVATTRHEAYAVTTAVLTFIFIISSIFYVKLVILGFSFFLLHLYSVRKFLFFVFAERGFCFTIKSALAGFVLYLIIYIGAFFGIISLSFKRD